MGAQTEARLKQFLDRYKYFEDPTGENTPPYHYGTHYSSAMGVAGYMIRMEPFTQYFLKLQVCVCVCVCVCVVVGVCLCIIVSCIYVYVCTCECYAGIWKIAVPCRVTLHLHFDFIHVGGKALEYVQCIMPLHDC